MKLENKINNYLMKYPKIKKVIKRIYQRFNVLIDKRDNYGNFKRITPDDSLEYFFGYYDKSPESKDGKYYLSLRAKDTTSSVASCDSADIILIDSENIENYRVIGKTRSWNVQQGCMLQWLGPDFKSKIIYNDFRNNNYCSVIYDIEKEEEVIINEPIYAVSNDGKFALTLDFSRLHTFRPGYGYSNIKDSTHDIKIPQGACIKYVDLVKNNSFGILRYSDLVNFDYRKDMDNCFHKVNHIMISPNNEKIMFLHRWIIGNIKKSRLITMNLSDGNLFNLLDYDMISHCFWKDNDTIITYARYKEKDGYYLLKDRTHNVKRVFDHINNDGHPSYSNFRDLYVTDTYPNKRRMSTLRLLSLDKSFIIGKVFAPFDYDNEMRCDLHPRWNYNQDSIIFDSVYEGNRRMYKLNINDDILDNTKINKVTSDNKKIKILYLMTSCRNCGPAWQTLNIIKNLDRSKFDISLVTLYEEDATSIINKYYKYIDRHYFININKKQILFNNSISYINMLEKLSPDIVHSVGVFPNYLATKFDNYKNVFTLRNYMFEDYIQKFGRIKGNILSYLQMKAMDKADKVVVCSNSLNKIYNQKLGINIDSIQNGVDLDMFGTNEKKKLNIKVKENKGLIFIYTGQLIKRKNLDFMIDGFLEAFDNKNQLIILGDGPLRTYLEKKYEDKDNVLFKGKVNNVKEYLKEADILISASLSEGLPNSVIEGMAMRLPVVLSDIDQHREILEIKPVGGVLFDVTNIDDYIKALKDIKNMDLDRVSYNSYNIVSNNFSAKQMSLKYQELYLGILK